jgi:hypothetical protein
VTPHGDHVLRDELSELNARIEPGCHEIDPTVVGRDVEFHIRIVPRELSQLRGEHRLRREPGDQEAHPTHRSGLQPGQVRQRCPYIAERRTKMRKQLLAGVRRCDAARRPREQSKHQSALQAVE